jgi:tRNA pseudouridine13 synthase
VLQVRARNWETNRLVGRMARSLQLSRSRVGFAGTKDKRAVTTQGFSFKLDGEPRTQVRLPDVEVLRSYRAVRALTLGDLDSNAFEIAITGVEDGSAAAAAAFHVAEELKARGGVPNFFGTQRFGSLRPVTHRVGAAIVERDYAGALATYLGTPSPFETEDVAKFRQAAREGMPPAELLRWMPQRLDFERKLVEAMVQAPSDPLHALLALPRNLVLMFIHAHQSELFNRVVSERLARGVPLDQPTVGDLVVPLQASGSALENEPVEVTEANLAKIARQVSLGRIAVTGVVPGADVPMATGASGEVERKVLEDAGRTAHDFVLDDLPRFTTTGVRRPLVMRVQGLRVDAADVRGKPAVRLAFELPRGCYATVLLREVLKRPESAWARATADEPSEPDPA